MLPTKIAILSQGEIVANSLANYLFRHPEIERECSKNKQITCFTTESKEKFAASASVFLNYEVDIEHIEV